MAAVRELAGYLAEYGGDLHTHAGWIARGPAGLADGYRYARRVPHACGSTCDRPCPGWHWQYVGRAFVDVDAVDVLLEVIGGAP